MAGMKVTFYLYRITLPDEQPVSRDLFEPVLSIASLAQRHQEIRGERVTLWDFDRRGQQVYGYMYRSQTKGIDEFLSGRSGNTRPIPLDVSDDEGVTGRTHFLYDPSYDILVLQGGRRRVGPGLMMNYMSRLSRARGAEINPTITVSQYQRYRRMNVISCINIALERPDSGQIHRASTESTDRVIAELAQVEPLTISLKLTRGQERQRQLNLPFVRRLVERLLRLEQDNAIVIKNLAVKGAPTIDDELDEVNLINDRMKYEREVAYDEHGPSTADCYAACGEAYARFEGDISQMYQRRNAD